MDVLHFQKTQHSHIFNIGKREISTLNAIIYVRLSYMNFSFEVGKKNESTDTLYNNHKMKQIQAVSIRKRKNISWKT